MRGHGEQVHWPGGVEYSAYGVIFILLVVLAQYGLVSLLCWLNMDVQNEQHTWPFMASIAVVAAAASSKVTKPKPRERPVYLSTMTLACRRTRGFANKKTGERGFADLHKVAIDCGQTHAATVQRENLPETHSRPAPAAIVKFPLHCNL